METCFAPYGLGTNLKMRLGYTEFSFGYAFTENLIRSSATGPKTAPIFPNLVQEAQKGFDVRIDLPGLPLFFQYKLPELMRRDTAREIATYNLAGITVPFFRMPLMPSGLSRQHELLINLEKKYPKTVLYASPRMQDRRTFNLEYANGEVHRRSIFFSPTHGALGQRSEAEAALAQARKLNPKLTIKWYRARVEEPEVIFQGLVKAGLPEQ
jgi:hypothetical protein